MKILMALVLSFGMVLLGTAPVMASGQVLNAPKSAIALSAPMQPLKANPSFSQLVIPTLPELESLGDEELDLITGDGLGCAVAGAAFGVAVGAAISFYAWATGHNPSSALQAAYETVVGGIVSSAAGSAAAAACAVF